MSSFFSEQLSTGWELKCVDDDSPDAWLPVSRVPTVVHLDLLANKKISDPSLDMNELDCRWVAEKSWIYKCNFPTPSQLQGNKTILVFEGLDTFSEVLLNGKALLSSDNMFISHRIDVTADLRTDSLNSLEITFASALLRAREIKNEHPEHKWVASEVQGEIARIGVRKADYHWGWDWGPRLMAAGPWRPVRIETFASYIEDISVEYVLNEDLQHCKGVISARVDGRSGDQVTLALCGPDGKIVFESQHTVGDDQGLVKAEFALEKPELWYPHGYGSQSRYQLEGSVLKDGLLMHHTMRLIGFRNAVLIQEPDSFGKSFYFRINGIDIFAGGSCWIPADNFVPRVSPEKYRKWMELMVEGNQIMTRIWGGGIYEEDAFFESCDELGVLVWQDFLFACGSYPTWPAFLASFEEEARCNVRRLRHHPSLVIFAGGNENYYIQEKFGLEYDYEGDKDPQSWLKSNFPSRFIYEYLLPKIMIEEAPSLIYHPDSPWGDGKIIVDTTVGDIHQWDVWHGIMRPYQTFGNIGGRFNSEFGMEAFPHMSTIEQCITDPSERYSQSKTLDFHNKADGHERRLASYVMENFRVSSSNFENWVYLTQLLQSEAMLFAYRSWRRQWGKASNRQCGGALVWQFNDCWPTTSWAIVDYFLVRKPSFYAIKRALQPLAVAVQRTFEDWTKGHSTSGDSTSPKPSKYDLWIASSKTSSFEDAVVELRVVSIRTGHDVLPAQNHEVRIEPNGITTICESVEISNSPPVDAYVISATLTVAGKVLSRDIDWPQPYKYLSFKEDRGLVVKLVDSRRQIEISAERPTKGVVFDERPGLTFSDNGIDVIPGQLSVVEVDGLEDDERLRWTYLGIDERYAPEAGFGSKFEL